MQKFAAELASTPISTAQSAPAAFRLTHYRSSTLALGRAPSQPRSTSGHGDGLRLPDCGFGLIRGLLRGKLRGDVPGRDGAKPVPFAAAPRQRGRQASGHCRSGDIRQTELMTAKGLWRACQSGPGNNYAQRSPDRRDLGSKPSPMGGPARRRMHQQHVDTVQHLGN
jgi:hypothetical protein